MAQTLSGSILFEVNIDSAGNITTVTASTSSRVGDYHQIAGNVKINNGTNATISSTAANGVKIKVGVYNNSNYGDTPTYLKPLLTQTNSPSTLDLDSDDHVQLNDTKTFLVLNQNIAAGHSGEVPFHTGNAYQGIYAISSSAGAITGGSSGNATQVPEFPMGLSTTDTLTSWNSKYIKVWFENTKGAKGVELGLASSAEARAFISSPLVYSGGSLALNMQPEQQNFEY